MSNSNPSLADHTPPTEAQSVQRHLLEPVQGVAFWASIALPFVQVPLLLSGLREWTTLAAFLALLALNVFTLYVGHTYGRE
ncbi:hypothetical protein Huta_2023 [Halorhabdus utahensis DSM 12940]|mgnify:FL=1|uniref:Uncharacterized protein n=1 Tax=Halorhabdus utahensis (strain DSM 12940 / JCM 11049 / AX-2) TaxID=519442 RepID=C7NTK1_HALUD|nr:MULTISPECIES: hypothetical protein [Halorhabdus]ACV12191.1 hypothetical protein Huta_2023 [Halorhabdus utahensis DSM 12940]WEL18775.1 putative membrane protein [Halorhabdus sp. SVX81]